MNIKSLVLVGILVIIGGGAFVYFDPLDMNLLGLKQKSAVAQPAATPHAAPKAAVASTQTKAPAAATAPSPTAVPVTAAPPFVAAAAQAPQPKLSKTIKTASKPDRAKNLDLRHCLDLEIDAAIAKCAGE